jgi:hypothetical protein
MEGGREGGRDKGRGGEGREGGMDEPGCRKVVGSQVGTKRGIAGFARESTVAADRSHALMIIAAVRVGGKVPDTHHQDSWPQESCMQG